MCMSHTISLFGAVVIEMLTKKQLLRNAPYLNNLHGCETKRELTNYIQSSNVTNLRILVRLVHAVGIGVIPLLSKSHRQKLCRFKNHVKSVISNVKSLVKEQKENLICILTPLLPILRIILLPLFVNELGVGESGSVEDENMQTQEDC